MLRFDTIKGRPPLEDSSSHPCGMLYYFQGKVEHDLLLGCHYCKDASTDCATKQEITAVSLHILDPYYHYYHFPGWVRWSQ